MKGDDSAKSIATIDYFNAVDELERLRGEKAPVPEVEAAKLKEQQAWDRVKELMPDSFCR